MDPAAFGPFLKEARMGKELTQEQLAEKLNVSAAAVSKWERGRCLPDIAKLQDLARALDLSVLELLDAKRQESAVPRQELADVYAKTLEAAQRQHAGTVKRAALTALCLAALASALYFFPVYRIAMVWAPSCFDTGEVSLLAVRGSSADRETARPVLEQAEAAFADLAVSRQAAQEKYGLLGRYCPGDPRAVRERHSLALWSAHFTGSTGYLWVYYTQTALDEDGGVVMGSWDIPSLWYLERDADGEWIVSHIKEHP